MEAALLGVWLPLGRIRLGEAKELNIKGEILSCRQWNGACLVMPFQLGEKGREGFEIDKSNIGVCACAGWYDRDIVDAISAIDRMFLDDIDDTRLSCFCIVCSNAADANSYRLFRSSREIYCRQSVSMGLEHEFQHITR